MPLRRLAASAQFGKDAIGQDLPQFDAPLIEAVDRPDRALGEHAVFVERQEAAERRGVERVGQDRVGRSVALGDAEWRLEIRLPLRHQFRGGFAEGQRLGLGEQIGHQQVVLPGERAQRPAEADHIARNQLRSLVKQLIE